MEEIEALAGSHVMNIFEKAYDKALHGRDVMFRFNGVQIILIGRSERP